jgi:hypothetical protein
MEDVAKNVKLLPGLRTSMPFGGTSGRGGLTMNDYLSSKLVRVGLGLLIFGPGPLVAIILAAKVGLWPDPNPNPVGPGILAGLTFWPAVICLLVGIGRVWKRRRRGAPELGA